MLSKVIAQWLKLTTTFSTPLPSKVHGFDISHWAGGPVNFTRAKASGAKFVFIKAKDGLYTSNWFTTNWVGARNAQIARGAYLWLYPSNVYSTSRQAEALFRTLSGDTGELLGSDLGEIPAVVDFEWTSSGDPVASDLYGFVTRYEQLSGKKPIIYTAPAYWAKYGSTDSFWSQYLLWIANYQVSSPYVPRPWDRYTFWQWTTDGNGYDYGLDPLKKKAVDLDYFYGTAEEFNTMFGTSITPQPPEVPKITYPAEGIVLIEGREFECNFTIVKVKNDVISALTVTPPLKPNGGIVDNQAGDIVSNGMDFDFTTYNPIGMLVSGGKKYSDQQAFEPFLHSDGGHGFLIQHKQFNGMQFAISGKNYIVKDGDVHTTTSPSWYEKHPRTIIGLTSTNDIILLFAHGRTAGQAGLDYFDAAKLLLRYGAQTAISLDGGDSSQLKLLGHVTSFSSSRRYVGSLLSIKLRNSNGGDSKMWKYNSILGGSERIAANIYAAKTGLEIQAGAQWESDVAPHIVRTGIEEWIPTPSGNWTAAKFPISGDESRIKVYASYEQVDPPPPSEGGPAHVLVEMPNGERYEATSFTKVE